MSFTGNPDAEAAHISALADFVKDLREASLAGLVIELQQKPKKFEVYCNLKRDDWKEFYGGLPGIHVYNYLHPTPARLEEENRRELIIEKENLAREKENLAREKEMERVELEKLSSDVAGLALLEEEQAAFTPFNATNYQISFPFFQPNGEAYLTLLGRDEIVKKINSFILLDHNNRGAKRQKYWPIVISTSRGRGKTFLLKMMGMQKVKAELRNVLIKEAGSCGRILSFDFAVNSTAISSTKDVLSSFPRLMIYFLCHLFNGKEVDGINFDNPNPIFKCDIL